MGTTLTGTTPANTYDSLIKVTDNGPLSGTAKYLSDGLGNDSALALSTSNIGIGTNNPTSVLDVVSSGTGVAEFEGPANATVNFKGVGYVEGLIRCGGEFTIGSTNNFPISFLTNNSEKMRITAAGNVGIGTTNANRLLVVQQNSTNTYNSTDPSTFNQIQAVRNTTSGTGYNSFLAFASEPNGEWYLGSISKSNYSDFVIVGRDATYGERVRITSAGNVGIGTSAPAKNLVVSAQNDATLRLNSTNASATPSTILGAVEFFSNDASAEGTGIAASINASPDNAFGQGGVLRFNTRLTNAADAIERMRITSEGYVRLATGGIQFNGDTAAANALDDYEEGTWAMGITFGGASTGVTYGANSGTYTRIGRQVTANGYLLLSNKGTATGNARLTGLPYTLGGANGNLAATSLYFENISFANQFMGFAIAGQTNCALYEITEAGVYTVLDETNFTNNSAIIVSLTYFV